MKKLKRPYKQYAMGGPSVEEAYQGVIGMPPQGLQRPSSWGASGVGSAGAGNAAGAVGAVATLGNGLMDAIDVPNAYGNQSMGVTIGKGALTGAATGAVAGSVVPGIGTAAGAIVGGVVGGVTGLIKGKKLKRDEVRRFNEANVNRRKYESAVSNAIGQDPGLINGYQGVSYYENGGNIKLEDGGVMIKPSHRGKFTRWAKNHDMSVAEATSKVLAHKDNYSSGVVKMANFSRNFGGHENGGTLETGSLNRPGITTMYMNGGDATPLNSQSADFTGNTHAEGGIKIPQIGAELEDGETTSGNFVFSDKLGYAKLHRPIARAIGKIEKKAQTPDRINSLNLLRQREQNLAATQEAHKQALGIS